MTDNDDIEFTVISETVDRYGCPAKILFDPAVNEYWWEMEDELEGPFSSRANAEADLASR